MQLHIILTTGLSTLSHKHSLEDALASTAVEPITSKPERMNIYYLKFVGARNLRMTYLDGSGSGFLMRLRSIVVDGLIGAGESSPILVMWLLAESSVPHRLLARSLDFVPRRCRFQHKAD